MCSLTMVLFLFFKDLKKIKITFINKISEYNCLVNITVTFHNTINYIGDILVSYSINVQLIFFVGTELNAKCLTDVYHN